MTIGIASTSPGKDAGARYAKIVQWSDEDQCFVGSVPDLFYGGCHGDDPRQVFDELCQIVDDVIAQMEQDGDPLPQPADALEIWRKRTEARAVP